MPLQVFQTGLGHSARSTLPHITEVTMSTFLRYAAGPALALSMVGTLASAQNYTQTNLVSNTSGVAPITDPALVNPWGMSRSSSSPWWIADNATGVSTLYNGAGTKLGLTVTIPAASSGSMGTPTGTIYNGSKTDFLLAPATPALFLFSTLDGSIVGWNPGVGAVAVVKTKDGSSYTGLTSAMVTSACLPPISPRAAWMYLTTPSIAFGKAKSASTTIGSPAITFPSTCRRLATTSWSPTRFMRKAIFMKPMGRAWAMW
jgi:hypothetical protein